MYQSWDAFQKEGADVNVFEAVRDAVTARQAAEAFGIRVNRSGMACCPFHNDRHPSMKVDQRFHCFGCQADGDAIDLTARLFGLSKKDAAVKIADTFGIRYEGLRYRPRDRPVIPVLSPAQEYKQAEDRCYRVYCDYAHLLRQWKEKYAPKSPDEEWDDRFVEACHKLDYIEYVLDEVFLAGTIHDRAEFVKTHGEEVLNLERRIFKLTAGRTGSGPEGGEGNREEPAHPKAKSQDRFDGRSL